MILHVFKSNLLQKSNVCNWGSIVMNDEVEGEAAGQGVRCNICNNELRDQLQLSSPL